MRSIVFTAALAAASLSAASASALPVVDVDNLVLPPAGTGGWSAFSADTYFGFSIAQTWTANTTALLSYIALVGATSAGPTGEVFDVTLSVYRGVGGAGWGSATLLGSRTNESWMIPNQGIAYFDFSALGIYQAAGETLTWEMSIEQCVAPCYRDWTNTTLFTPSGVATPSYAGGSAYAYSAKTGLIPQAADANFRIGLDVPEPSSWALMIMGFGGVGAALRRRAQVAA